MVELNTAVVEQPEVVARQGERRRLPPWQPADLFAGRDVQPLGHLVLVPDVLRDRLGDDACATDYHASGDDTTDETEPLGPPSRRFDRPARLPVDEDRVVCGVPVTDRKSVV